MTTETTTTTEVQDTLVTTTEYASPEAALPKLAALRASLRGMLFGASAHEAVDAVLLSVLSGRHVMIFGPRGSAKTTLVDALIAHLPTTTYFGTALHPFKKPDDLIGSIDLPAFQAGQYQLKLGRMANANISFLDEASRASDATLESLFDILEKKRIENAGEYHYAPLWSCIGAANAPFDPDRLGPLRDRFPIAVTTRYIDDAAVQMALANAYLNGFQKPSCTLHSDDILALRSLVTQVVVSDAITSSVLAVVKKLRAQNIDVSDRRWLNGLDVVRAAAVLDGRTVVRLRDCRVLSMVFWDFEDDQDTVIEAIASEAYESPFEDIAGEVDLLARTSQLGQQTAGLPGTLLELPGATPRKRWAALRSQAKAGLALVTQATCGTPRDKTQQQELRIRLETAIQVATAHMKELALAETENE